MEKASAHYKAFMKEFGIDTESVHAKGTPDRVAKMFVELTQGLRECPFEFRAFPLNAEHNYDQLIIQRNITFQSVCAHHHVPFHGTCAIGYLPKDKIIGLSKILRVVKWVSKQPTIQEDLTEEIAELLLEELQPRAVFVQMEAQHLCISGRGVNQAGSHTITHAMRGDMALKLKSEFIQLAKG
jgi:GTP cyclohydrolase I